LGSGLFVILLGLSFSFMQKLDRIDDVWVRVGLVLVVVFIIAALAMPPVVSGLTRSQFGGVPIFLEPASVTLTPGETVIFSIKVGASVTEPVDTVEVYLDFDPTALQVDAVTFGPILNSSGRWKQSLLNQFDNNVGRVEIAASKGRASGGGSDSVEEFVLATVQLKALAAASNVGVIFDTESVISNQRTKAVAKGVEVTGVVTNSVVTVAASSNAHVPTAMLTPVPTSTSAPVSQSSGAARGGGGGGGFVIVPTPTPQRLVIPVVFPTPVSLAPVTPMPTATLIPTPVLIPTPTVIPAVVPTITARFLLWRRCLHLHRLWCRYPWMRET